jgi:hypothetical protein
MADLAPTPTKSQGRFCPVYFGNTYPIAASTSKVRCTAGRAIMR